MQLWPWETQNRENNTAIMSERDEKLLNLVEKLSNSDKKFGEDELTSMLTKNYTLCRVPPLQDPNVPYTTTDFEGVAREAEINLNLLLKLLKYVRFAKARHSQQFSHVLLKYSFVTCLMAACEYCDGTWEWSSPATASVSKKIMNELCEMFDCSSMEELFANSSKDLSGRQSCDGKETPFSSDSRPDILKAVLQKLSEMFKKDNWRQYPSLKMSYWWILRNIKVSSLASFWYDKGIYSKRRTCTKTPFGPFNFFIVYILLFLLSL